MQDRVVAYIDGFNLYYGLKSASWKRFYWLDLQALCSNLLISGQNLVMTKYFTSRIASPGDKQVRQAKYIEALETLSDFQIYYGRFQSNLRKCRQCGFREMVPNEKMTDVNIATELLRDAFQDRFDTALLVSADSDLTALLRTIRELFPGKRVIVVFPPMRHSSQLQLIAHGYMTIGRATIARSLFASVVMKANGFPLRRPPEWS